MTRVVSRRANVETVGSVVAIDGIGARYRWSEHRRRRLPEAASPVVRRQGAARLVHVSGGIGYDGHPAPARRIWHGDANHRQYVTRDEILRTHQYAPASGRGVAGSEGHMATGSVDAGGD